MRLTTHCLVPHDLSLVDDHKSGTGFDDDIDYRQAIKEYRDYNREASFDLHKYPDEDGLVYVYVVDRRKDHDYPNFSVVTNGWLKVTPRGQPTAAQRRKLIIGAVAAVLVALAAMTPLIGYVAHQPCDPHSALPWLRCNP